MAFHVSLSQFQGPLDLLLHLIQEAKIDIRDVFVSQITEQFLGLIRETESLDMNLSSEFIEMAARLLDIKSRRLLPKAEEDEELQSEEEMIIRQLEDYQRFKAASQTLQQIHAAAGRGYCRLPEERMTQTTLELGDADALLLAGLFTQLMGKFQAEEEAPHTEREIRRDMVTITERMEHIRRLVGKNTLDFHSLFPQRPTREEVVVTFLAMLELLKQNAITIRQDGFGKAIVLARAY